MSSWKKAAKSNQRVHRERSQPEARADRGLLEKKKDYSLRAKNHNDNENTLKLLRKRALDKNPDEFYYHMINSKIQKGVHHEIQAEDDHTPEQIQLMQTQDLKYINMKRTIEANQIKRLQSQLHMIDSANNVKNKHIFFVDDAEERNNFNVVERLKTHPKLLNNRTNRLKITDLEKIKLPEIDETTGKQLKKQMDKSYKELAKRIDREKELTVIQQKMELKRALMDKKVQKPKRIKGATKNSAPVYKWKFERKK